MSPRFAGFRLAGGLDLAALRRAWDTTVSARPGDAVTAEPLRFTDLTAVAVDDVDALAAALCGQWATEAPAVREAESATAVAAGPHARLHTARIAPADLLLFVTVDGALDEAHVSRLVDTLSAAYAHECHGAPAPVAVAVATAQEAAAREAVVRTLRTRTHRYEGASLPFVWDGELARRVAEVAAEQSASPTGVLLAALRALLLRHGGHAGDGTLRALLGFEPHPLRGDRDLPQLDAVFADRSAAPAVDRVAGLRARPVFPDRVMLPAGLVLVVDTLEDEAPRLSGRLEYRTALYNADSAANLLDGLRTLLAAALDAPDTPVDTLPPPLPAAALIERYAALPVFKPVGHTDPLPVQVAAHAVTDAPAVVWDGRTTGYAALDAAARDVTRRLAAASVAAGDAVVVRMPPGPLRIAALLGVLAHGAKLCWLAPGPAGERGRSVLTALGPACVVVEGDGVDELLDWYRTELGGRVVDVAAGEAAPPVTPASDVTPGDTAYIAFTSGSTGRPKGIPQTHAALTQFTGWLGTRFAMGRGARVAQWVSPDHDPALAEVGATLATGGTLYVVPDEVRVNPDLLVPWLAEHRITHLQTVPSFARDILDVIARTGAGPRLDALGHLLLMGEALPPELLRGLAAELPALRVFNLYGPTEVVAATWHEVTGLTEGPVPIGRAIPGRQLLVLDENDLTCPVGATGSIVVRSPYVTSGYLGSADRTSFRPVEWLDTPGAEGGWYRTGDLGRRLPDGTLEYRGREDFQIKLAGNRVELTEIEGSLASHASVLECAVVPVAEPASGLVRGLDVHVVPHRDADGRPLGAAAEWRAHLRGHFGSLTLPATFHEAPDRLPRNAAGKVDRSRLRAATAAA
ncbi:AMP-binding protein [Streptomyces sp. Wb2n-11]|uniref:AMP-binding protein n=1 Tax=Streptomyces sp. Wb2n-11 TaxID=1030533 RepID=UPI000A7DBA82|nr:AMP-binding protein [Streptomyces sp. Wb2n-11]